MAAVEYRSVKKTFPGGVTVLHALSLAIADGECLVLVGPSGCGKSTALRLLAGLEQCSGGEILIGGSSVNHLEPQQRNIAMVFQSYALYPHLSVRENLAFPLRMRRLPSAEIKRLVDESAKMLALTDLLDRLPKQLSGGQRQRVAMGRALVRHPACFLMDEPLSNLDAKLRVAMRAELAALQRRTGTTTLYVTHDQVEAMTMGQRVAVMSKGHLQQVAPPQELYARPANLFVAAFIGSPSMNLFRAPLRSDGGALVMDLGNGQTLRLGDGADQRWPGIARLAGGEVVFGIRPECLHLAATRPDLPAIDLEAGTVEILGAERLVHARLPVARVRVDDAGEEDGVPGEGCPLVARLPGNAPVETGQRVRLAVEVGEIHVFGSDGKALRG